MPSPQNSQKSNGNNTVPVSANDHNTRPSSKEPAQDHRKSESSKKPSPKDDQKNSTDERSQWGHSENDDLGSH